MVIRSRYEVTTRFLGFGTIGVSFELFCDEYVKNFAFSVLIDQDYVEFSVV